MTGAPLGRAGGSYRNSENFFVPSASRRGACDRRSGQPPRNGVPQRVVASVSGEVQKAQRRAAIATSLRHSGHFLLVGSGAASPRRIRARSVFIGSTMKKYTAAAMRMNEITALMKSPIGNLLPLIVNSIAEKS